MLCLHWSSKLLNEFNFNFVFFSFGFLTMRSMAVIKVYINFFFLVCQFDGFANPNIPLIWSFHSSMFILNWIEPQIGKLSNVEHLKSIQNHINNHIQRDMRLFSFLFEACHWKWVEVLKWVLFISNESI